MAIRAIFLFALRRWEGGENPPRTRRCDGHLWSWVGHCRLIAGGKADSTRRKPDRPEPEDRPVGSCTGSVCRAFGCVLAQRDQPAMNATQAASKNSLLLRSAAFRPHAPATRRIWSH